MYEVFDVKTGECVRLYRYQWQARWVSGRWNRRNNGLYFDYVLAGHGWI